MDLDRSISKMQRVSSCLWELASILVDEPLEDDEWWAGCHGDEEFYLKKKEPIVAKLEIFCGWLANGM
jgi:hypothetical protein